MLNKVQLIGNLGSDPETRSTQNGGKICNFKVAVTETWKDKQGERQERTEWVPVVIFGPLADVASRYLAKGSKVYIEGKFTTRKWQDKDGNDRYSTEVVLQGPGSVMNMLDSKKDGGGQRQQSQGKPQQQRQAPKEQFSQELDDEIPF